MENPSNENYDIACVTLQIWANDNKTAYGFNDWYHTHMLVEDSLLKHIHAYKCD